MSQPVIQLNSRERIVISFDDIGEDLRHFKFTVIHCQHDWTTSGDITPFDYLDGFNEENIDKYSYSYNTKIRYVHYQAYFPSDNMRPKVSGNYLLKVYDESPANVMFTVRFMVVEPTKILISGKVEQASRMDDRMTSQQVDLVVRLNGFRVYDVGREIRVAIRQNGRWDNMMMIEKPRIVRGEELDYRYDENITFRGGNQFRNFDIRTLKSQTERIAHITEDTAVEVHLLQDQPRTYKPYITEGDINGQFMIKNDDHAENFDTESEYVWVHFFLPFPAVLTSGSFNIIGEFALWQINDATKMKFDYERRGYALNLLLKQGYYNYLYVLDEPSKPVADESLIEGSHWETENDFSIYVYFCETGSLYDKLVAVDFFNSRKQ